MQRADVSNVRWYPGLRAIVFEGEIVRSRPGKRSSTAVVAVSLDPEALIRVADALRPLVSMTPSLDRDNAIADAIGKLNKQGKTKESREAGETDWRSGRE